MQRSSFAVVPDQKLDSPACPKCGVLMRLSRVDPDKPDHDRRTFECQQCGQEEMVVVKFR